MIPAPQPGMLTRCVVAAAVIGTACLIGCAADSDERPAGEERFLSSKDDRAKSAPDAGDAGAAAPDDEETPKIAQEAGSSCDYVNTCQNAKDLGDLAADDGSPTKSVVGSTSAWVAIRALESVTSTVSWGKTMKITAELTVPAGSNYDLFMYADTETGDVTCSKLAGVGTSKGDVTESVHVEWGEPARLGDSFGNFKNDSRPIRFEVRKVSGPCDPAAKWKLTVFGNKDAAPAQP